MEPKPGNRQPGFIIFIREVKMEDWTKVLIGVVIALIIGIAIGYVAHPEKQCETQKQCEVCQECVQEPCVQEPCVQQTSECNQTVIQNDCEPCVQEDCNKASPNEQLIKDQELTEEQAKHARVQTVFMTCEKWQDRETENGNLVDGCWKEKREIAALEPRMNGNTCAIVSLSGC